MLFRLISLSTTTGWLDWEHGELWVAAEGLLRRRRGWLATAAGDGLDVERMAGATLPVVNREFSTTDMDAISRDGGVWIPADHVKAGRLRSGIITGRASLELTDGRTVKLLWARSALTFDSLKDVLAKWVDGALTLN